MPIETATTIGAAMGSDQTAESTPGPQSAPSDDADISHRKGTDGVEAADDAMADDESEVVATEANRLGRMGWARVLVFAGLPGAVLVVAIVAGYLKWLDSSVRDSESAATESVEAATDSTIKMLSYRPDTVDQDLSAARDRLTGAFQDSYTALVNDVVIPGSKEKQISAVATVPAAASVSASQNHAVVLAFVNQTTTIGSDAPSSTASTVRVTLDKVGGRWLISDFTPV